MSIRINKPKTFLDCVAVALLSPVIIVAIVCYFLLYGLLIVVGVPLAIIMKLFQVIFDKLIRI